MNTKLNQVYPTLTIQSLTEYETYPTKIIIEDSRSDWAMP